MLYKWTCHSSRGQYRDLTAEQLRELADRRSIQPTDSVGCHGYMITAYKFRGLFPNAAFLEINWRGSLDGSTAPVTVSLNNHVLGRVQFGPGFCFWQEVQLGRHLVGVKLSLKSQKQYVIDIHDAGIYCCDLLFGSGFWANFQDKCNIFDQPARFFGEGDTLNAWESERQAAQCQHCGVEWAVNFLGEKVLDERQQYKSIARRELQWMPNPDPPFYGALAQVPVERIVQVVTVVSTVREHYQCGHCGKKWKKDCTYERVP